MIDMARESGTISTSLMNVPGDVTTADRVLNTESIGGASMSTSILPSGFSIPQSGKFSNSYPVRWRHHAATTRVHATLDGKHTICHKPVLGPNRVKDPDNTLITCRRCIAILKTHQRHSEGLFRCARCHEEKPHSDFYEVRAWRHSTVCKVCFRKDRAESRARLAKWIAPVGGAK